MNWILNTIIGGFTSWKTTLAGIVGALAILLNTMGIFTITPEHQATIVAFCVMLIGWFSKDSTQTGEPLDE